MSLPRKLMCLCAAAFLPLTWACGTDRTAPSPADDEKPKVSASPAELTLTVGQSAELTGSIRNSAGQVFGPDSDTQWSWTTLETSIIKLDKINKGRATVTGLAEGDAVVVVSTIGNTPGSAIVHVVKNPTFVASVRINPSSADLEIGETLQPSCTAFDALGAVLNDVAFTWTSATANVASVTAVGGVITGLTPGSSTVRCTVTGGTATASVVVTVHGFELTLTPGSATIPVGGTSTLGLTIKTWRGVTSPLAGRTLTWESSADPKATVADNGLAPGSDVHRGLVTGVSEGQATITVTLSGVGGGKASAAITVRAATPADLIGTYTKNGSRQAPGCSPSAFGASFAATLRVIADASNPAGIRLEEVHPTITLPWSFLTITNIPGGQRISTGRPTRTINGALFETYLEIDIVGGRITGRETFKLVGSACEETYTVTGTKQ